MLFFSGILGGLATPFTLALMMLVARNGAIMNDFQLDIRLTVAGWTVTTIVALAAVVYLFRTATGAAG